MSNLSWYWHRLRAMSAREMALHARKKWRQSADASPNFRWADSLTLQPDERFPPLATPEKALPELRKALQEDVPRILAGQWRAFGHLTLRVDDPPRWHKDYLAGVDLPTNESAFKLNHRALPQGADSKLIWELSRWYELVRLAQAAHVLNDARAAAKCVEWLEDWVKHNPPFRGWNWTSALESGLRLVQFTWMDALLARWRTSSSRAQERWSALRRDILPPHVWFTWRHQSFGSSANNHLIGELAGLILALVRWPELETCGATLRQLVPMWEREVLAQFESDGGNKEQALSYQLFSFEFCCHVRGALAASGRRVSDPVDARLWAAASFFWNVQSNCECWGYGDSDNAFVTPLFAREGHRVSEWRRWVAGHTSPALEYWLGTFPQNSHRMGFGAPAHTTARGEWWLYEPSGIAVLESGSWWLRWDLSPLGYLATAAHGHLDALHISIWFKGKAFVIDPGTGAYYADKSLRQWLASRPAHNAPCPDIPLPPHRLGPFLWSSHHPRPRLETDSLAGVLEQDGFKLSRKFIGSEELLEWSVEDACVTADGTPQPFSVRWQFAPGTIVKRSSAREFILKRDDVSVGLRVSEDWADVLLVEQQNDVAATAGSDLERKLAGTVSPAFRAVAWAPFLKLVARPGQGRPCVFSTTFVASAAP